MSHVSISGQSSTVESACLSPTSSASRLAMSSDPLSEARDDAAPQATPDAPAALRLVEDEPSTDAAAALDEIDTVVLVQLMCTVASLKTELRALKRRVSFLEGAMPV